MRVETDIPISLEFVKRALGATPLADDGKKTIKAICTDSRTVKRGDLFIGIRGERYDGSDFIPEIKRTALFTIGTESSDADLKLKDTGTALLNLASAYKKLLPIKTTVAITGSVGKTTTKELTRSILQQKFRTHATFGNLNNEIGVPFTVLSAPKDTEALVIEAGMNHAGEITKLSKCIEPDLAVITKIGNAHIGNLGSREKIAEAKLEILDGMKEKRAIVPDGEPLLTSSRAKLKTVSRSDTDADFTLSKSNKGDDNFYLKHAHNIYELYLPGLSIANFHTADCLAFALAVAFEVNMSEREIRSALDKIDFSRFSSLIRIGELLILNDSYNSSPDAVISALDSLRKKDQKKSALIGDMLELGEFGESMHFEIGVHAARSSLENLYIIGEYSKYVLEGAVSAGFDKDKVFINENPNAPEITARQIRENSFGELILFKASRKIGLERIIDILKKAEK